MPHYEYKVIPAPSKGRKAPGVKKPEDRFAHALETAMNALSADGWEYLRADILPSDERQGLTSTHTVYRSVLVFRRAFGQVTASDADAESDEIFVMLEDTPKGSSAPRAKAGTPVRSDPPPAPKADRPTATDHAPAPKPVKSEPPISGAAGAGMDTVYRSETSKSVRQPSQGSDSDENSETSRVTFTRKRERPAPPDNPDEKS